MIELKATDFEPGFVSQLSMYQNIVDDLLKHEDDKKTIGLLLVKSKNETVVKYSIAGYKNPYTVQERSFPQVARNANALQLKNMKEAVNKIYYPKECTCCKEGTISDFHDVCMICGWEDDEVQNGNPLYSGGAKLSYSSNDSKIRVSSIGVITVPAKFVGKAVITISAAETMYPETVRVLYIPYFLLCNEPCG